MNNFYNIIFTISAKKTLPLERENNARFVCLGTYNPPNDNSFLLHPVFLHDFEKQLNYEIGGEEGILALIFKKIAPKNIDEQWFLDGIDEGYLLCESNTSEEELDEIVTFVKENKAIFIGDDLYAHPRSDNIASILGLIQKYSDIKIFATHTQDSYLEIKHTPDSQIELPEYNGTMAYIQKGVQNTFTISKQFSQKIKDINHPKIQIDNINLSPKFIIDENMIGTIGILQTNEIGGYPYKRIKILSE